jgi:hypothetical protein
MGFDTSHHPVDLELAGRIADYISGKGSIDELVADSVRCAKMRFRANAWGLGVQALADPPPAFDSGLHIWGRPFFVTVEGTEAIAHMIDRYLAARTTDEVDAIARDNLVALDANLPGRVTPSASGTLPGDADLAASIRSNVDLLRRACKIAETGGPIELPNGGTTDARELLAREAVFQILSFCADARPGWMDRGYVWPTSLVEEAKLEAAGLFEPPRALLGSLASRKLNWFLDAGLSENYMVGALVTAAKVPALCAFLGAHRAALEACFDGEVKTSVQKLIEAANDTKLRGLAFAEATEVYSGFSGILN